MTDMFNGAGIASAIVTEGTINIVENDKHMGVVHKTLNHTDAVYYLRNIKINPNSLISKPITLTVDGERYVVICVMCYEDIEVIYVPIHDTGVPDTDRDSEREYFGCVNTHEKVRVPTITIGENVHFGSDSYTYAILRVRFFNLLENEYGIDRMVKDSDETHTYLGKRYFVNEHYTWVEFYKEILRLVTVEKGIALPVEIVKIVDLLSSVYDINKLNLTETNHGLALYCVYPTYKQGNKNHLISGEVGV